MQWGTALLIPPPTSCKFCCWAHVFYSCTVMKALCVAFRTKKSNKFPRVMTFAIKQLIGGKKLMIPRFPWSKAQAAKQEAFSKRFFGSFAANLLRRFLTGSIACAFVQGSPKHRFVASISVMDNVLCGLPEQIHMLWLWVVSTIVTVLKLQTHLVIAMFLLWTKDFKWVCQRKEATFSQHGTNIWCFEERRMFSGLSCTLRITRRSTANLGGAFP